MTTEQRDRIAAAEARAAEAWKRADRAYLRVYLGAPGTREAYLKAERTWKRRFAEVTKLREEVAA